MMMVIFSFRNRLKQIIVRLVSFTFLSIETCRFPLQINKNGQTVEKNVSRFQCLLNYYWQLGLLCISIDDTCDTQFVYVLVLFSTY